MSVRKSYRTKTWKEGKILVSEIAKQFDLSLDERDETIVASNEDESIKISVFLDPRGFGFVKAVLPQKKADEIDRFIRSRI